MILINYSCITNHLKILEACKIGIDFLIMLCWSAGEILLQAAGLWVGWGWGCYAPCASRPPSGTTGLAGTCSHYHCRSSRGKAQLCKSIVSHCSCCICFMPLAKANYMVKDSNHFLWELKSYMRKIIGSDKELQTVIHSSMCVVKLKKVTKSK